MMCGEADLLSAYRSMYRGMVEQDTDLLDDLLAEEYTLTHMTGHTQTKKDWLKQIESGEMRYFSAREHRTSLDSVGEIGTVVGQSVVDACIWGHRRTWNLQLTTDYARSAGRWIATKTVASTY